MRIASAFLLLLAVALVPAAKAQTFQLPLSFTSNNYLSINNTCLAPSEAIEIPEFGYEYFAPIAVYRVQNSSRYPGTALKPWRVTMVSQSADLAIFVCRSLGLDGSTVSNCVDGSDNGPYVPNVVDVPGAIGTYYVIVSPSLDYETTTCGPYVLTATLEQLVNAPPSVR